MLFRKLGKIRQPGKNKARIIESYPLLNQIITEQNLGYLFRTQSGGIIEINPRGQALIQKFAPSNKRNQPTSSLKESVTQLLAKCPAETNGQSFTVIEKDNELLLDISHHVLPADNGNKNSELHLLLLKEISYAQQGFITGVKSPLNTLTPRQRQVLNYLLNTGMSYDEIAFALSIKPGTLRKHLENIFKELGVHSRAELMSVFR